MPVGTTMAIQPMKQRRTQAERSEAMRKRILDATLNCLASEGYAGTTVSRIIEVAGVSRGALMHHFDNKEALIAATAKMMVRRVYMQMGQAMGALRKSDDRLHDILYNVWKNVFNHSLYRALLELLLASKRDDELATTLQQVWTAGYITLGNAAEHYLEPIQEGTDVRQIMVLAQWLLRGMALDHHLVEDPGLFDHFLRLWSNMLALHLRAKPGVTEPPPRPPSWDMLL